jgi:hypothetical protein
MGGGGWLVVWSRTHILHIKGESVEQERRPIDIKPCARAALSVSRAHMNRLIVYITTLAFSEMVV